MSFIHEKAQIHTLNKSTEIFDPVKSKRRYKVIILLLSKRWHNKNDNTLTLLVLI